MTCKEMGEKASGIKKESEWNGKVLYFRLRTTKNLAVKIEKTLKSQ